VKECAQVDQVGALRLKLLCEIPEAFKMTGLSAYWRSPSFTFQLESPLRKKVNGALLSLRENGTYLQLYDKWFGGP
jgi:ABC-type amino acid transport substrate-binding protein